MCLRLFLTGHAAALAVRPSAKIEGQGEFIALDLVFLLFILVLILAIVGGYLT